MQNIDILLVGNKSQGFKHIDSAISGLPVKKHVVTSPEEALEIMKHLPLAMVLLDTHAKTEDSVKVAKMLDAAHPHLPMLFIAEKNKKIPGIDNLSTCLVDFIFMPLDARIIQHKILMLVELFIQQQNAGKLQAALEKTYITLQKEREMQQGMEKKLAIYMADLENTKNQLEQNNAEMERFKQIISYDLKQPIEEILSNASELLKIKPALARAAKQKIKKVESVGKHIYDVISTFREYSNVDEDKRIIKNNDLNAIISKVLDSFKDEIKAKKVKIEIPKPLPSVVCDGVRVSEVFSHLIDNAIKFSDKKNKKITISFSKIKDTNPVEYIFSVEDNGIGVDKEHFAYIFKMFKCLHEDGKYGSGTGVGLAFAEKILGRTGGRIWLESEPKKGSKFSFTLKKSSLTQRVNRRN